MKKKLLGLLVMLALVSQCVVSANATDGTNTTTNQVANTATVNADGTSSNDSGKVMISFAGDCTLGSFLGSTNTFANYWKNGPEWYLGAVKPYFDISDMTFINLEGPLTDHPQEREKEFSMRGEPKYVQILTYAGVDVVNLANNHVFDCGTTGFNDTLNLLKQNNIGYVGEGRKYIMEKNGVTVGFLGYKWWGDKTAIKNQVAKDIATLKETVDVVVVQYHWGDDKQHYANDVQIDMAHSAIDNGADVVVGAHPHVIQGIETYKGKTIAYSLGNFCFGANNNPPDKDSMVLMVTLDKLGNNTSVIVVPCKISSQNNVNDFRPTPQVGVEAYNIMKKLQDYSSIFAESPLR